MLKNISFNPIFFYDPIFVGESILKKKNWLDKRIGIGLKNRRFFETINTSSYRIIIQIIIRIIIKKILCMYIIEIYMFFLFHINPVQKVIK
jgi:hypothetical protein